MDYDILVVGSLNMDLVVQTTRYPECGETIKGDSFNQIPGGKGANQAVQMGRLNSSVAFIGSVGGDKFAEVLLNNLQTSGVNTDNIFKADDNTGIALITVENDGENRIIVVPGANASLTPGLIKKVEDKIKKAKVVLLQLEIPLKTVIYTIELANYYDTKVILDPAPAQKLPEKIYAKIDYLLPNEGELDLLVKDYGLKDEREKAEKLLSLGCKRLIVTKGKDGVFLYSNNQLRRKYESIKVKAVDSTAAGDSFAGAFTYGLVQGWGEDRAIKFANLVAAISVTRFGAQSSLPSIAEVKKIQVERGLKL